MKHYYQIANYGGEVYEFDCPWEPGNTFAATEAAEDFHSNHDGWESSWPLIFILCEADGTEIARFEIERESRPEFYAYEISQPENSE